MTRIVKSVYVICKQLFGRTRDRKLSGKAIACSVASIQPCCGRSHMLFHHIKEEKEARSVAAVAIAEEELAKGRCLPMNVFSLRKPTCALER